MDRGQLVALDELLAWACAETGRHFIVKMGNTYNETRWRVCVWAKKEGGTVEGLPGEGYGNIAETAVREALNAWTSQAAPPRHTGTQWYLPNHIAGMIERNNG